MNFSQITISPAKEEDRAWIAKLMQESLSSYYSGDHHAHSERIFNAHIAGGHDHVGFFSYEQRMFIAKYNNNNVGMVHIVGKKQSTYKISPLIVDSEFRGKIGVGSALFEHALSYAEEMNARQIYCTVAAQNIAAMQFFLRKRFIKAGYSDSHYKPGIVEHMLYRPILEKEHIASLDKQHVSVRPLAELDTVARKSIRQLLLDRLSSSFSGIDDAWVNALFEGYERRNTNNINLKYKLIFAATNSSGGVIGVAGATPKKGSPIKVMPFIALNDIAFEALLTDIPFQLREYGHKLYIHIEPSANQVQLLQKLGWKINALMPSAYMTNVVTQQWSFDIGEQTIRALRIKDKFFDAIHQGTKNLEVRVGYSTIKKISVGETIQLHTHTQKLDVRVKDIRIYDSFARMLDEEQYKKIVPDVSSKKEADRVIRQFYPKEKEKLGVYVMQFEVV